MRNLDGVLHRRPWRCVCQPSNALPAYSMPIAILHKLAPKSIAVVSAAITQPVRAQCGSSTVIGSVAPKPGASAKAAIRHQAGDST